MNVALAETCSHPGKRALEGLTSADDPGPTFRLRDLEAMHCAATAHPLALEDVLGDGALLERLPILRHLRREVVDRGYRFEPFENLPVSMRVLPLLQLMRILDQRVIPYQRSAVAVAEVLATAPEMRFADTTFRDACAASYTFHEGAHALFWELVCAQEGRPRGERFVEVLLASEAFAMALEEVASLQTIADARRSTRLFLAVGSYADPYGYAKFDRREPGSIREIGQLATGQPGPIYRCLAAAHLIANLRPTAHAARPGLPEHLASYSEMSASTGRVAPLLVEIGFDIDPAFRKDTTETFFRHLGLESELAAVRERPIEASMKPGGVFHDYLESAMRLVLPT